MIPFLDRIGRGVLLFDGAIGTMLQQQGLPPGEAAESWVLERPEAVLELHRQYLRVGAEALTTNSFGGTRFKLANWTDPARVGEINERAAALAKRAAGDEAYVAGSVGPTGVFLEPLGEVSEEEMFQAYREQMEGLLRGGVDVFIIETQTDVREAQIAVRAARGVGSVPVVANMTYERGKAGFRTMMGNTIEQCVDGLLEAGADVVGTNCGTGIVDMIDIVREMRGHTDAPILAEPNAGLPELVEGRTVYLESPQQMTGHLSALIQAGANVVGGCCGTTPEHIALFKEVVGRYQRRSGEEV